MERKMNIAEFAALVGTTSKTIYGKINNYENLPVIEQLHTVNERVKGREIKLIITNSDQIEYYQNLYGKNNVIDGEYYETVTENNGAKPVNEIHEMRKAANFLQISDDILDRLMTLNNEFNNRIEHKSEELIKVQSELATVKGNLLLLEDKASREGFYINEINELKKDNNRLLNFIYGLLGVIVILLIGLTWFITFNHFVNSNTPTVPTTETTEVKE